MLRHERSMLVGRREAFELQRAKEGSSNPTIMHAVSITRHADTLPVALPHRQGLVLTCTDKNEESNVFPSTVLEAIADALQMKLETLEDTVHSFRQYHVRGQVTPLVASYINNQGALVAGNFVLCQVGPVTQIGQINMILNFTTVHTRRSVQVAPPHPVTLFLLDLMEGVAGQHSDSWKFESRDYKANMQPIKYKDHRRTGSIRLRDRLIVPSDVVATVLVMPNYMQADYGDWQKLPFHQQQFLWIKPVTSADRGTAAAQASSIS